MRRSGLIAIALGLIAVRTSLSATSNPPAEIRAVMDAQVAAWNRGDIDGFMDGYARSNTTAFVSGGKTTYGWRTVRDRYRKKYNSRETMGTLKFSDIRITLLKGDQARVHGRWQLIRKTDRPHGSFILIFRHRPEGWRIVHDETS